MSIIRSNSPTVIEDSDESSFGNVQSPPVNSTTIAGPRHDRKSNPIYEEIIEESVQSEKEDSSEEDVVRATARRGRIIASDSEDEYEVFI